MLCIKGVAHGKMIELEKESGFSDDQPLVGHGAEHAAAGRGHSRLGGRLGRRRRRTESVARSHATQPV